MSVESNASYEVLWSGFQSRSGWYPSAPV